MLKGSLAVAGGIALAPLAAACGGRSEGESAAATLDRDAEATIDYFYAEYSAVGPVLPDLIEGFRGKFPNVEVKTRAFATYAEILQAVQAGGAARELPALAQVGYTFLRYTAGELPHLPISEAAERDPEDSGWLDGFPKNVLRLGQVDGVQEGMPFIMGTPYLIYNRDLFEQAGIGTAPGTWTQMREAALRLKQETGKVGFMMPDNEFWTSQAMVESNGARVLIEEGGAFRTGVGSPEAVEALDFWAAMINEDDSAIQGDWTQGSANFAKGNVAMLIGSSGTLTTTQENTDLRLGTAPFPTWGDKPRRTPVAGNATFIFAQEEDRQLAAWEFIKHINSPEAIDAWVRSTGFIPTRTELAEGSGPLASFYDENPLLKPDLEQVQDFVRYTSWPGSEGLEANQVLVDARDRILAGEAQAATAMPEAAERISQLINA
jgi:multiple sugar transport system substrate-binding protein